MQDTFFKMAVTGLKGERAWRGQWSLRQEMKGSLTVESPSFKAKKTTVKFSASEDHLVCVLCWAHVWITNFR